ncbi:MAG: aminoglycoside 6-adenylyltransferase [Bacillota bacterium]
MNQTTLAYEQLMERIVAWAQTRPDIRAVIVLGSRARVDRPADEWSDLDIVLIVTDSKAYLTSVDWLRNISDFWITFLEPTATGGEMERRVLFDDGLDVDFAIIPYAKVEQMVQHGFPPEVAEVFHRGMRVLLDRDGLATRLNLPHAKPISPRPPTQSEFLGAINDFWYHAVWTAKKLRRGELWTAKACCDGYMKRLLLMAVELQAKLRNGLGCDTWYDGRFLERWADPRVLDRLRSAFAHYDEDDIGRALVATMDLFRWLAQEAAERLDYPYPTLADERATELVDTLLSGKTRAEAHDSA